MLVAHIQAEEETCYSSVSGTGPRATARIRDSIADHDAIREIIGCQWCAFTAAWKRDVTLRPVPRLS